MIVNSDERIEAIKERSEAAEESEKWSPVVVLSFVHARLSNSVTRVRFQRSVNVGLFIGKQVASTSRISFMISSAEFIVGANGLKKVFF